jgi:hypothetical protein
MGRRSSLSTSLSPGRKGLRGGGPKGGIPIDSGLLVCYGRRHVPAFREQIHELLDSVYRRDSGRILATLIRLLGDFDLAEEAMRHIPRVLESYNARLLGLTA